VRIDLTAPGTEIAVTRDSTLQTSTKDEKAWVKAFEVDAMRTHLQLVVREAFDVARRRLQDYARRRRRAVKTHRNRRVVSRSTRLSHEDHSSGGVPSALQESQ
jgi:hypothetical protein